VPGGTWKTCPANIFAAKMFPDDLKIRFVRGGSTDKHKRSFGMCVACNVDSRRCQKLRVYNLTVVLSRKVLETGAIIGVRVRKDFRRSYQGRTVTPPSTHIYISDDRGAYPSPMYEQNWQTRTVASDRFNYEIENTPLVDFGQELLSARYC